MQLALGVAVLHDLALAAEVPLCATWTARSESRQRRKLVARAPSPSCPDPGGVAVGAVADVLPGQARHEGAERARWQDSPRPRSEEGAPG